MATILNNLVAAIRGASRYNPDAEVAPACILWTDKECQWESIMPRLRDEIPELLSLGELDVTVKTGPAIWLRVAIAEQIPAGTIPIIYLPGVGRGDLRAVEACPSPLKPLAELQYRGVTWKQTNGKDWTVYAYLNTKAGGLDLDIAQDAETLSALQRALPKLLDEDIESLRGRHLDKEDFNKLVNGDIVRTMLEWLDKGEKYKTQLTADEWVVFRSTCKDEYKYDPDLDGLVAGGANFANGKGGWDAVWQRYVDAPHKYPYIPELLRKTPMPPTDLWANVSSHGSWPQWNDAQEISLREALLSLKNTTPAQARGTLIDLAQQHQGRTELVWASLGQAPMAQAVVFLRKLAELTKHPLSGTSPAALAEAYIAQGWMADANAISALETVSAVADKEAVAVAIRSIYSEWLMVSATNLQQLSNEQGYPAKASTPKPVKPSQPGEVMLFIDGLRYDVGNRLAERLANKGFVVNLQHTWAPLPSVTATGKPAASPVATAITTPDNMNDFSPISDYQLKKLLEDTGWQTSWQIGGSLDDDGHNHGIELVRYIDPLVEDIVNRVQQLAENGKTKIHIVTDHGWLLLPGGLPHVELAPCLTEGKWGRCATIKPGAITDELRFPWHWDQGQYVALPRGICSYIRGKEYAHGGLSVQECVIPQLVVEVGTDMAVGGASNVTISRVVWKGLRCRVTVNGVRQGLRLDIRTQAGNPSSSILEKIREIENDGEGSVLVADDDGNLFGTAVTIVITNTSNDVVAQMSTMVGGGKQ